MRVEGNKMLLANWRTYVVILLLSLGGWGGWKANSWMRPQPQAPAPVINTVTVERVVTRTVTVVRAPDGTETTTTTDTTASKDTSNSKPTVPVFNRPKWSAEGIVATKVQDFSIPKPAWSALLYHRLGDTNAWAGAGYDFGNKAVLLAVRVDF